MHRLRPNLMAVSKGLLLAAALGAAPAWAAPYVWVTTEGTSAQVHVGDLIPASGMDLGPALAEPKALLASGQALPVRVSGDGYVISLPGDPSGRTDVRFTARSVDRQGVLTIFEAKAGRAETRPVNALELVPTEPNGNTFQLFWNGRPVPATQVEVETSSGWRRTLHAAPDGTVSLASPELPELFRSHYVLEVTARVDGAATFEGKTYDQVLHTATLSFEVSK